MKIKGTQLLLLIIALIALTFPIILPISTLAKDTTTENDVENKEEEIEDLQDKIDEYEEKLEEIQGKAKTLNSELESMNHQINVAQLKIQNSNAKIRKTEEKIEELGSDIEDLKSRISRLEDSIDYQKVVLSSRMRERYKSKNESPLLLIFGSSTLNSILHKTEYLKVMEKHDNKLVAEMAITKTNYDQQKNLFEDKKEEEEKLKFQLEEEKAVLDQNKNALENKKSEKARLLSVTQNDEKKYQELLAEAQRELNQIVGAAGALINQESREVKKGELIGIQGNSGYSFGAHLHFGVYRYSSLSEINGWNWYYSNYVDPSKKLEGKTVYWNTGCESASNKKVGSGDWDWPMKSITVSQGFGKTCWSNIYYGGKPHPAFDMYGPSNSPVYAVEEGDAYFCRNCLGDGGNGVFIFHDDNYMTVYWHLK
jgi:peptidoglycan hydrolase CwlO-like protein